MVDVLSRGWQDFLERTEGPMHFRFVMQPLVAVLLAAAAGLRDAKTGRPAFLWSLFTRPDARQPLLREVFKDTGRVLTLALLLDFVYQLLVLRGVYLLELLFTGLILAVVPYLLVRGPVNRLAQTINRTEVP